MSLQCIKNAVEQFGRDGFAAVIVDCATCGSTFKNEYPRVLQEMKDCSDDIPEELLSSARKMAKNTFDIMQFVAKHEKLLPEMNSSEKKVKVTYHDPCHLSKGQSVKEEPRRLLKHIPGIEFVEAAGADECCGGGGSFQVDYPAISKKIIEQKLNNIKEVNAPIVATGCPSCLLTIGANFKKEDNIELVHPITLIQTAIVKKR